MLIGSVRGPTPDGIMCRNLSSAAMTTSSSLVAVNTGQTGATKNGPAKNGKNGPAKKKTVLSLLVCVVLRVYLTRYH